MQQEEALPQKNIRQQTAMRQLLEAFFLPHTTAFELEMLLLPLGLRATTTVENGKLEVGMNVTIHSSY